MEQKRLRSHLGGTLPVSIAIHLVAVLALIVIPLVANVVVPTVSVTLPDYVRLAPMPPPPVVVMRQPSGPRSEAPPEASSAPPTQAPPSILTERAVSMPGPEIPGAVGDIVDAGITLGSSVISPPPAPEPPKPAGPIRIAQLPVAPRKIADARPVYPDIARTARVEGTVVMEAVLDPAGTVTQIRVIRSIPLLDQAAIDAVRQWRYSPSVYNGRPVSVLMTITIRFTLQ